MQIKKEDAGSCKHHNLKQDYGVGVVANIPFVVPCIKLVYPSFRYPIHGLKKTTITHTHTKQNKNSP